MRTVTVAAPRAVRSVAPSAWVTIWVGMVMGVVTAVSSARVLSIGEAELINSTPTAPAFCALSAFTLKVQVPRSRTAIFPATLVVSGWHPSLVGAVESLASTACIERSKVAGPNAAAAADTSSGTEAALTRLSDAGVHRYICMRGRAPSAGVDMFALLMPPRSWPSALMESPSKPPRP